LWWDGEACRGGEIVKVVQAAQWRVCGLDGVARLLQQASGVADPPVACFGADAEQGGDGDMGKREPMVQDGSQ
jgi:hypothetical protein